MQIEARDHREARELADGAGALLLDIRSGRLEGDALKNSGDSMAHEFLALSIGKRFPRDGFLSEEGADDPERLERARTWIVDPLDGTREFAERPRVDWAVHVALVVDHEVRAGAVALPARGLTLATDVPLPAPGEPSNESPRIAVSRTRPTEHAQRLVQRMGGTLVPMGSAGAKAMAVVLGEADVYAHSGGQYEWDSAAPVAVAAAAGFHVSRLDGSPLRYNQANPWMPDLLVCRPDLAENVLDICGELTI